MFLSSKPKNFQTKLKKKIFILTIKVYQNCSKLSKIIHNVHQFLHIQISFFFNILKVKYIYLKSILILSIFLFEKLSMHLSTLKAQNHYFAQHAQPQNEKLHANKKKCICKTKNWSLIVMWVLFPFLEKKFSTFVKKVFE